MHTFFQIFLQVLREVIRVIPRFPAAIAGCVVTTTAWINLITSDADPRTDLFWGKLLMTSLLYFFGAFLLDLVAEDRPRHHQFRIIGYPVLIVLAGLYFFCLPHHPDSIRGLDYLYFILLLFAFHLAIALAGIRQGREQESLWTFNNDLFLRFIFSTFNVIIIFIGIALALFSMEKLFALPVSETTYFQIWALITFLVHPMIVLGGIPRPDEPASSKPYPRALSFTLRFIALPLTAIYVLILYAYMAKIVFTWEWPTGWVAFPILILATIALLTDLLAFPLRTRDAWARYFHRLLYPLILPLTVLLLLSINERIATYGITENRYFVAALGIWLLLLCLLQTFRGGRVHLVFYPASLLLVCLVAGFSGPLSAFSTSERSQLKRFMTLAESHGLLDNGNLSPNPRTLSNEDFQEFRSILRYLLDTRGLAPLEGYLENPANFKPRLEDSAYSTHRQSENIIRFLGITSEAAFPQPQTWASSKPPHLQHPAQVWRFDLREYGQNPALYVGSLTFEWVRDSSTISIRDASTGSAQALDLTPIIAALESSTPTEPFALAFQTPRGQGVVHVTSLVYLTNRDLRRAEALLVLFD